MTESFFDLKSGDQVVLEGLNPTIATIDRVTETQIIIGQYRFNRKTGYRIGGIGRYASKIMAITFDLIARIKK